MAISKNTATFFSMNGFVEYGRSMNLSFDEILDPKPKEEEVVDDRSCQEIVDDIWAKGFNKR